MKIMYQHFRQAEQLACYGLMSMKHKLLFNSWQETLEGDGKEREKEGWHRENKRKSFSFREMEGKAMLDKKRERKAQ